MRTSDDMTKAEAFFCEDITGGCLVECSECSEESESTENLGEPCYCTNCGVELFYRPWWEW